MKKNKKKIIILLSLIVLLSTGCTKTLTDKKGNAVVNKETGQNLTSNILCRPTDKKSIELYEKNGIDLEKLPYCECKTKKVTKTVEVKNEDGSVTKEEKKVACKSFNITSGGYEGLWANIFVKPLAFIILFFGRISNNYGIGLLIVTILIRLIAYPITKKTAMQSEYMKKAQPEIARIEKKYAGKDQNDREVMMQKSQEMMMVYKKYNVSPFAGCLLSFIQLPLFIAFLEAINRVPAIFEEKFIGLHLGTTPSMGIRGGNYLYIVVILLVAITTFFSFRATQKDQISTTDEMANQQKMMTNMFTIMIIVMSIFMTTALDIYWMASNLFTIVQNILVRRNMN